MPGVEDGEAPGDQNDWDSYDEGDTGDVLGKKAVASRRMWAMRMEVTTDPAMWMRQLKAGKPGACLSWLPLV